MKKQVNYKVNGEEWKEAKDKEMFLKRNMVLETLLVRLWKT